MTCEQTRKLFALTTKRYTASSLIDTQANTHPVNHSTLPTPHHTRLLLLGCLLVINLILPFGTLASDLSAQLPDIGKAGTSVLSPREEQQLGREFMRSVQHNLELVDDPPTVAYLQGLADQLVTSLQGSHQPITVFLVDDPSINAFAGPGGYIGIHTGLLLAAGNEGELVSVLAHEIAHVTQRHLVRAFEASSRMSLPTMGALIAAIVLGASNPQVGEALLATTMANSTQQQLSHSRSNEQEADNIGLDLMVNADYDPRAMVAFFEILQDKQRSAEFAAPEFMRTHPLTLGRVADARNRAEQYPAYTPRNNTTFELMQARIITLGKENTTAPLGARLKKSAWNDEAKKYFRALQAAKKGDYPQARTALRQLIQENRHRVLFPYSAAQIELADNRPRPAKKILSQALTLFPGNLSLIELYANTLLRLEQPRPALEILKVALRKNPEHYRLYQPYAKAANALHEKAEAYRALAEWQYAQGGLYQAVAYLEQALKTPGLPPYERLTLQARQDMLKSEVERLKEPASQAPGEHLTDIKH
ncbi:MAG: M48 family metalloprotease [Gammaproteobacteria bacterium]|nr:M48 family metalloprotease [Gammaproteobacteria bacterium]